MDLSTLHLCLCNNDWTRCEQGIWLRMKQETPYIRTGKKAILAHTVSSRGLAAAGVWFFRVARSWRTLHMRFCNNELTNLEEDMWLPIPEINCECMEWECCFLSQTVRSGNETTEVFGNLELLRKLSHLASAAV